MPAITSLAYASTKPLLHGAAALSAAVRDAARNVWRAIRNRQDAAKLAAFDDRMLADIGLTRSDVRDAFAEPLWSDPTHLLTRRHGERRRSRRRQAFERSTARPCGTPPADRPGQYLM